jgi:hypothetical protein
MIEVSFDNGSQTTSTPGKVLAHGVPVVAASR